MWGVRASSLIRGTWHITQMLAPVRPILRALAATVAPDAVRLDERGWLELEAVVERALGDRPASMQRQFVLFLRLLEFAPRFRHGRAFSALSPERRARVVAELQKSRVLLLRRGIWGARTLVFMGYYSRPEVQAALGYRASAGGWASRLADGVRAGVEAR